MVLNKFGRVPEVFDIFSFHVLGAVYSAGKSDLVRFEQKLS